MFLLVSKFKDNFLDRVFKISCSKRVIQNKFYGSELLSSILSLVNEAEQIERSGNQMMAVLSLQAVKLLAKIMERFSYLKSSLDALVSTVLEILSSQMFSNFVLSFQSMCDSHWERVKDIQQKQDRLGVQFD